MAEINNVFQCRVCGDLWSFYERAEKCCFKVLDCYQCDYCEELFGILDKDQHLINGKCPKELEAENE